MNSAQIHLALNHVPLFLSLAAGIVLIIGFIRKNELVINLSLFGLVAGALFTAPVFLTGEGTEELVEKLPGVNENLIGEHEDFAKISMIVIAITGAIALIALLARKAVSFRPWLLRSLFLLSIASFLLMAQTASLGGKIRHSEIVNGTVAAGNESGENEKGKEEKAGKEEKDDD